MLGITYPMVVYFAIIVLVLLGLLFWYTSTFNYWKELGVPYIEPHWFYGSVRDPWMNNITWIEFCCRCYKKFKSNGFGGIFVLRNPLLMICDPGLIETVLVNDFTSFHDRVLGNEETLANSPYFVSGEKWRAMRFKLIPGFATKKVKESFEQVFKCSEGVLANIEDHVMTSEPIEIEPVIFRFAVDAISSCAFGMQLMSDTVEGETFRKIIDLIFHKIPTLDYIKHYISCITPNVARMMRIKTINSKVTSFFTNFTKSAIKYRLENKVKRNDFLQMLLNLKLQEEKSINIDYATLNEEDSNMFCLNDTYRRPNLPSATKIFTDDCIASLMYNFLTVGPNPSAGVICYALFEVAKNKIIQKTLADEISSEVSKHGGWTYEAVRDMAYLDQVLQETLRLYNFNPCLLRTLNQPYKLPGTNFTLKKGLPVCIPVAAVHLDPDRYPSPEDFIPERFAGHNYKPTTSFMPFGYGPRICISIRYAVILMKVVIARILHQYSVDVSHRTQLPLKFHQFSTILKAKGGIWLDFEKRNCHSL